MAAPKKISLLPQEGFEHTTLGRIVTWTLTAGRIIVVITQLVVIVAFLSRFWLDRRLTNLNEKIQEQEALVKTYQSLEKEWVRTQEKLKELSQLSKTSVKMDDELKAVTGAIPSDIALTQLSLDKNAIQISGLANFEGAVERFINNLSSLNIGKVELTNLNIATGEQLGTRFAITITRVKNEKGG